MSTTTRRSAALWLVGAALVGAAAAVLHVMRSDLGGGRTGLGLTVSAYVVTGLAALMLYHGVVVAARAQDAAAPPPLDDDEQDPLQRGRPTSAPGTPAPPSPPAGLGAPQRADVETHEPYTFKRGKRVGDA